jgi:hypothetical protein
MTPAHTVLHAFAVELGARHVPFAGHEMPLQFARGIKHEHLHARAAASLFDVSHMGQMRIRDDKYWPPVGRVDNVHGDRNLFCGCVPTDAYAEAAGADAGRISRSPPG